MTELAKETKGARVDDFLQDTRVSNRPRTLTSGLLKKSSEKREKWPRAQSTGSSSKSCRSSSVGQMSGKRK